MAYEVFIIHEGYSKFVKDGSECNCTCTVIKGNKNIIVDTMTSWDAELILKGLAQLQLTPDDIHYVVSTHGHSDHLGCNYLFLKAIHIVGHCISKGNFFFDEPFSVGQPYFIDGEDLKIIPTPGHTCSCISVIVQTKKGTVAIVGDLFEKEEDLTDEMIWIQAGSMDHDLQRKNRAIILSLADYIIPGHGPMFKLNK